jgi:hypothetical protein
MTRNMAHLVAHQACGDARPLPFAGESLDPRQQLEA